MAHAEKQFPKGTATPKSSGSQQDAQPSGKMPLKPSLILSPLWRGFENARVEAFVIPKLLLAGEGASSLSIPCCYERQALFSQQPPSSGSCSDKACIFFGFQPKIRGRTVLAGGRPVPGAYRPSHHNRQPARGRGVSQWASGKVRTERANIRHTYLGGFSLC